MVYQKIKVTVSGIVQGVGFRYFVESEARRLGLGGFVTNNSDGTVSVIAVGTATQVRQFLSVIRLGPPLGRVDDMKVQKESVEKNDYSDFEIV